MMWRHGLSWLVFWSNLTFQPHYRHTRQQWESCRTKWRSTYHQRFTTTLPHACSDWRGTESPSNTMGWRYREQDKNANKMKHTMVQYQLQPLTIWQDFTRHCMNTTKLKAFTRISWESIPAMLTVFIYTNPCQSSVCFSISFLGYLRLGCMARDREQIFEASDWFQEALHINQVDVFFKYLQTGWKLCMMALLINQSNSAAAEQWYAGVSVSLLGGGIVTLFSLCHRISLFCAIVVFF